MDSLGRAGWTDAAVAGVILLLALASPTALGAEELGTAWNAPPAADGADVGDPDLAPEVFGLGTNMDFISAEEFICSDSAGTCDYSRCHDANYWCADSTGADVSAAVEVPAGALITGMRVLYFDASVSGYLIVDFQLGWTSLGTRGFQTLYTFVSSGTPGVDDFYLDITDFTVERRYQVLTQWGYRSYFLRVRLPATSSVQLRGIAVFWKRQISPAPASQTFPDVAPGYWAFQEIEALAASGITTGFPDGTYRPTNPVTRAQMATFLARALGLHWSP